ncbi:hypothetical protein HBDW_11560 [Herbaspirillum sp. DW155]|uniref:EAL domain-containing protein n=1 Tax=Herbaspirillum sp. DW155 TaxID=3095609 RepID=UPI003089192B|nr:hypothetical protein HBDW_11560 [Herbaspirillum sp. DW155]
MADLPDGVCILKSFLQQVLEEAVDVRLFRAIVTLTKSLDLEVIVEGVEDPAQIQNAWRSIVLENYNWKLSLYKSMR